MGVFDLFKSEKRREREAVQACLKQQQEDEWLRHLELESEVERLNAQGNGRYALRGYSYDNGLIRGEEIVRL